MKMRALKALMWKARMKWVRRVRRMFLVQSFLLSGFGGLSGVRL
jgi:hypothetical protein